MGRKKRPFYRIVAIDSRKQRDSASIERLGYYHPLTDPPTVSMDAENILKWLRVGAQPSNTVLSLLKREGVWLRFRLEKQGKSEEQIHETMQEWFEAHSAKAPEPEPKKETVAAKAEDVVKDVVQEAAPEKPKEVKEEAPVIEAKAVEAKPVDAPVEEKPVEKEAKAEKEAAAPVDKEAKTDKEETAPIEADEAVKDKADDTEKEEQAG